jgi:hypothetical protein
MQCVSAYTPGYTKARSHQEGNLITALCNYATERENYTYTHEEHFVTWGTLFVETHFLHLSGV